MQCVICKQGKVESTRVEAELRVGNDHLLVPVESEACTQCGEAYYSPEIMRYLDQVRNEFLRKTITPASIGRVYQIQKP